MICFGSRHAPNLPTAEDADTPCVCFLTFDEMERNGKALGIAPAVLRECIARPAASWNDTRGVI